MIKSLYVPASHVFDTVEECKAAFPDMAITLVANNYDHMQVTDRLAYEKRKCERMYRMFISAQEELDRRDVEELERKEGELGKR